MNSNERQLKRDSYENMIKEKHEYKEHILSLYNKLSYRDKLLFNFVVSFLVDNPSEQGANNETNIV